MILGASWNVIDHLQRSDIWLKAIDTIFRMRIIGKLGKRFARTLKRLSVRDSIYWEGELTQLLS